MSFIKKIRIQNFKSLEDVTLEIKPLNFLFGPNSSGKSSVIKAILFLYKNLFPLNSGKSTFKIDKDTDLVSYEDIVTGNDTTKDIIFEIYFTGQYLFDKKPFEKKIIDSDRRIENFKNFKLPDISEAKRLLLQNYDKHNFDISIRYIFSFINNACVLNQIIIVDNLEKYEMVYTNEVNNDNAWYNWSFKDFHPETPVLNILNTVLCNNSNPFEAFLRDDYLQVSSFKEIFINDEIESSNKDILKYQENASRLYYLYFVLIPNIFYHSFSGNHLPTIRQIPDKKYLLNDEGIFDPDYYYNYLNEFYKNQKSLINIQYDKPELGNNEDKLIKNYLDIFNAILGLKKDLKESISRYLSVYESKRIGPVINDHLIEKFLDNLFWIFEGLEYGHEIGTYEDVLKYIKEETLKGNNINPELLVLSKMELKYSRLIYDLYGCNFTIESKRDYFSGLDERSPHFYFNLSILINNTLNRLGFDSTIFVCKTDDVGKIISLKSNGAKLNISNESSGLLQLLPVLFGLVYIKSDLNFELPIIYNPDDNSNIIDDFFPYIEPSNEYRNLKNFNTSLFIEQPELHLHPKLQCSLAEYIGDLVSQFTPFNHLIIETHSEHIIRKIQVLIARGKINSDSIGINYLYTNGDRKTKVKEMEIGVDGFFKEPWPDGFFDDSYNLTKELLYANKN